MSRQDRNKYQGRAGGRDRDQDRQGHRHSERGRPSFVMNHEEYDQRGGHNDGRERNNYSNHSRSQAGDQYRREDDDRFDSRGQYSSSRNYGGMGGFGGAQGFGTSRAGQSGQSSAFRDQDRGRYDATSGRGSRPEEDQYRRRETDQRHLYGGYWEYRREEDESGGNQDQHRGNRNGSFDYSGSISGGDFSPRLGGSPSRDWYTPSEGGYSRSGGYVGPGGVDRGSRRTNYDEDKDPNYGQTFGDDIHYDPTSRNRRDTHVQDTERRSMEKYGSESRDLDRLKGWHYDARLDSHYGRDNQSPN